MAAGVKTVTCHLLLVNAPTAAQHATTKGYVDDRATPLLTGNGDPNANGTVASTTTFAVQWYLDTDPNSATYGGKWMWGGAVLKWLPV